MTKKKEYVTRKKEFLIRKSEWQQSNLYDKKKISPRIQKIWMTKEKEYVTRKEKILIKNSKIWMATKQPIWQEKIIAKNSEDLNYKGKKHMTRTSIRIEKI